MTPAEYAAARHARFQSSMQGLVMDNRFSDFIDAVREYREAAIDNLSDSNVVGNERATMACIGEIAAYKSIVAIYDDFKNRNASEADSAADTAGHS